MTLQFPNNPSNGQQYTASNNLIYVWDGEKWITTGSAQAAGDYVNRTGDVMTGQLGLPGGGSAADAIQKQEVQSLISAIDLTPYVEKAGSTMTGDLTVPSLNGGQLAGFRNLLQNGSLDVNQRGATTYSTDLSFSADRWKVGVNTTIDVTAGGNPEAGTGTYLFVQGTNPWTGQSIETGNAGTPFVVGKTYTVSYWIGQDTPLSPGAAAGWSTNGNGVGLVAFPMSTPVLIETSASTTWRRFSQTFTVDSAAFPTAKCVLLTIQNTVSFAISAIQLEPGPVATPFEIRPMQTELALCQRYYQAATLRQELYQFDPGNGTFSATVYLPTTMRIAPTATFGLTSVNAGYNTYINTSALWVSGTASGFPRVNSYAADAEL